MTRTLLPLMILNLLLALPGCDGSTTKQEPMHQTAANVETDPTALRRLISLPAEPLAARYTTVRFGSGDSAVPGPSDWGVLAYIKMPAAEVGRLAVVSPEIKAVTLSADLPLSEVLPAHWQPGEDGAELRAVELQAGAFASEPLMHGSAYRLSEDEVLVFLQTL